MKCSCGITILLLLCIGICQSSSLTRSQDVEGEREERQTNREENMSQPELKKLFNLQTGTDLKKLFDLQAGSTALTTLLPILSQKPTTISLGRLQNLPGLYVDGYTGLPAGVTGLSGLQAINLQALGYPGSNAQTSGAGVSTDVYGNTVYGGVVPQGINVQDLRGNENLVNYSNIPGAQQPMFVQAGPPFLLQGQQPGALFPLQGQQPGALFPLQGQQLGALYPQQSQATQLRPQILPYPGPPGSPGIPGAAGAAGFPGMPGYYPPMLYQG